MSYFWGFKKEKPPKSRFLRFFLQNSFLEIIDDESVKVNMEILFNKCCKFLDFLFIPF